MNLRMLDVAVLGCLVLAGLGCKTENSGGGAGTGAPLGGAGGFGTTAGVGAAGVGTAGMDATAGVGAAGVGAAGVGAAGDGTAGVGAAGVGAAGMGTAGTTAGAGGMTAGGGGMDAAGMGGEGGMGGMGDADQCIAEAAAMGRTGACTECGCTKCLDKIMNCQDEACASVVACGQAAGCRGRDCYCGTVDTITCGLFGGANGACMEEIAMAAGICDANALDMCAQKLSQVTNPMSDMYDPNNPVSRANQVSICTRGQAADPGQPPLVPAVMAIPGMCETECAD